MVGTGGIEPPASSVSRKRSPTELRACPRATNRCISAPPMVLQASDFTINFYVLCQLNLGRDGARSWNQTNPLYTYCRPEMIVVTALKRKR